MTGRGKYVKKQAQDYIANQEQLAWALKAMKFPSPANKPITIPCIISWSVYIPHRIKIDSDNVDKAVRDALAKAGVIENDYLIRGTDKTRLWQGKKVSRVVVQLTKLQDESNGL